MEKIHNINLVFDFVRPKFRLFEPLNDWIDYMGLDARKPLFGGLQTTNAQTSLRIRAV